MLAVCWLRSICFRPPSQPVERKRSCPGHAAHRKKRIAGDDAEAAHSGGYDAFAGSGEGSDEAPSTSYRSDNADERFPSATAGDRGRGLWQALRGLLHLGHDAESAVRTKLPGIANTL